MAVRGLSGGERAALLVSECQNAIVNADYTDSGLAQQVTERGTIGNINRLAAAFRAAGTPVVHCTIAALPGFVGFRVNCSLAARVKTAGALIVGTKAAAIHDDIVVADSDIVSSRMHGMAPFTGTELDAVLRGLDIDTVVLAGVSTNIALPGAATEAIGLGYNVVLAEDATAGGTAESHQMQITLHLPLLAAVVSSDDVMAELNPRRTDAPDG